MTTDPNALGTLTLRSLDGATAELDAHAIPPGTVVILQALDPVTPHVLERVRQQLQDLVGDDLARRFLVIDGRWRIWPVTITEPVAGADQPEANRG